MHCGDMFYHKSYRQPNLAYGAYFACNYIYIYTHSIYIYIYWLNPNCCNSKHETEHEKEHGGSEKKARTRARKVSRRERKKNTN